MTVSCVGIVTLPFFCKTSVIKDKATAIFSNHVLVDGDVLPLENICNGVDIKWGKT